MGCGGSKELKREEHTSSNDKLVNNSNDSNENGALAETYVVPETDFSGPAPEKFEDWYRATGFCQNRLNTVIELHGKFFDRLDRQEWNSFKENFDAKRRACRADDNTGNGCDAILANKILQKQDWKRRHPNTKDYDLGDENLELQNLQDLYAHLQRIIATPVHHNDHGLVLCGKGTKMKARMEAVNETLESLESATELRPRMRAAPRVNYPINPRN